ncbi:hypothetical protein TTHERM_00129790 (macronuclear) [Tetrahymena thermophila SB210]|uniref:Uncharacterized protein n=1 Tax=Tetrahymena thermophila (strain SB210) TaxID=312017 RepID=I7MEE9_TETTS|nr:hypothetical protein TTHERM_00129790 [Tetrahymena thermophila SB210]EAR96202.1 hypothetical protein TTHERM_00129790 [Tetrahymena thermophila SB210]|eukprot:XP_001016447.1 hypothetical protein TTHERM_00129790 [Tetrahymena thermophila SB210]
MGCISDKQMRNDRKTIQLSQNDKLQSSQTVNQIIISIQQLVIKLQNIYTNIINKNQKIPEHYANLEPCKILQKLRENEFLSECEIKIIECKFRLILTQMKESINKASQMLLDFNQNNTLNQSNKKILLEIIMLYESTYINFFKYQENIEYKKFMQFIQSKCPKEENEQSFSQSSSANTFKCSFLTQDTLY